MTDGTTSEEIQAFWNSRSGLEAAAGTRDLIAKKLEMRALTKHLVAGQHVLDVGCGNGTTAITLAQRYDLRLLGVDFAEDMVTAATEAAADAGLSENLTFKTDALPDLPETAGPFDVIYSERSLINLRTWPEQKRAMERIAELLCPDGTYLMCENSLDGLASVNELRLKVGLTEIVPPWHNRYLQDEELAQHPPAGLELDTVEYISSTYHLLSRVLGAWLAKQDGQEPAYDAPLNQLALELPEIGEMGQTRLWVWRRCKD